LPANPPKAAPVGLARLLYSISHEAQSGVAFAQDPVDPRTTGFGEARVELLRGWVHAVEFGGWFGPPRLTARAPVLGPDRLTALCEVCDARSARVSFDAAAPPEKRGTCAPFHPAAALRGYLDRAPPSVVAVRQTLAARRFSLKLAPHASCLDDDERPLVAYLGRPRTLEELDAARLCPRGRADRLLAFLVDVRALDLDPAEEQPGVPAPPGSPLAVLELVEGASADEIRRAYRRLARELHPDRHPHATTEERERLARRFDEVHAAYRLLLG
jgi:DnaJ-domain-containing protein 1